MNPPEAPPEETAADLQKIYGTLSTFAQQSQGNLTTNSISQTAQLLSGDVAQCAPFNAAASAINDLTADATYGGIISDMTLNDMTAAQSAAYNRAADFMDALRNAAGGSYDLSDLNSTFGQQVTNAIDAYEDDNTTEGQQYQLAIAVAKLVQSTYQKAQSQLQSIQSQWLTKGPASLTKGGTMFGLGAARHAKPLTAAQTAALATAVGAHLQAKALRSALAYAKKKYKPKTKRAKPVVRAVKRGKKLKGLEGFGVLAGF
jgi:hypothetical protein